MRAPSPAAATHGADLATLLVLGGVAVLAMATFRDYGLGWDDYAHAEYGELLLAWYTSGFTDVRAFSFVNLYYYGGGFDMLAALLSRALSLDIFVARRLTGALVGVVGLAITWRLARRLGGPNAGFAAVVLLALCPLYYGHQFINAKDVPFAVAMAALLYALVRALDEYPRPTWRTVALFAIALGLTLGTRIMGGLAALFVAAALALLLAVEARALGLRPAALRLTRFVVILAAGLPLAYVVMGLVWPWAVQQPLNPIRALAYFSTFFEVPWREMFEGKQVLVPDMPRTYVPTLFALTMPELFVLAAVGGLAAGLLALARADLPAPRRAALALLLAAVLVPVGLTILTRPAMYNGLRHFVFVMPPLAVLAALALVAAGRRLAASRPRLALAAGGAAAVAVAVTVVDLVRIHPYEYSYFNRLAGGIQAADRAFMLDYWGLAFKEAGEQLRATLAERGVKPPASRRWRVATCGPHRPAQIALGAQFETTYEPRGADFALMLGEFYCRDLPRVPLVEVTRDGVVFARVYDIRGASLATIFATPPLQLKADPSLP